MATKKEVEKELDPITAKEVAQEMNEVMQYGQDAKTGEVVRPDELIDLEQSEKALVKEIKARAAEDLRPDDENSFSEDAWNWFIDNGVTPGDQGDAPAEDKAPAKKGGKADKEPAPAKKPAPKAKGEDGEEKRGIKKAMVPGGNEAKAIELAKAGEDLEGFIDAFTKIYNDAGNKDKVYIEKRAKIYYKLGYDKAGLTRPDAKEAPKAKGKAAPAKKEQEPEETERRGRGRRGEDTEPEKEEAPARGRRGR